MPKFRQIKRGDKAVERDFSLSHAQSLLDLMKKCPPVTWKLVDDGYEITNEGKIQLRSIPEKPKAPPTP